MREHGLDERLIRATASHGYGLAQNDIEPQHQMEKVLFAIDELSGLIGAAAIMRPSKSVMDLELKSVKKKYKDKKFAAGCSRDVIEKALQPGLDRRRADRKDYSGYARRRSRYQRSLRFL